jgi:hypothetical protein
MQKGIETLTGTLFDARMVQLPTDGADDADAEDGPFSEKNSRDDNPTVEASRSPLALFSRNMVPS